MPEGEVTRTGDYRAFWQAYNGEPAERVGARVALDDDGCLVWSGSRKRNRDRHPYFFVDKRETLVVRWLYEWHHGPLAAGTVLWSRCRVDACVAPWHREPLSRAEANGRATRARWERPPAP